MFDSTRNSGELEEKNLRTVISNYLKYWRLFIITLFICLSAVFLYIRYWSVTQYQINSTILVKDKNAGQGSLEANNLKNLGLIKNSHSVEDEMGILRSTGIMEKVISERSLNINFYIEGSIRDVEVYGIDSPIRVLIDETASGSIYDLPIYIEILDSNCYELRTSTDGGKDYRAEYAFGDLVQESFGTFTVTKRPDTKYVDNGKPLYFIVKNKDAVIKQFLDNLTVELTDKNGGLLNISFICSNKNKGEDVVSALIETYVEEMISYENELAENTIKMIDERLKLLSGEISGVEKSVEKFKSRNDLTDVRSNANLYIEQANDYKKKIAEYQTQINVIESIEQYMKNGDLNTPIPGALSANDPSLIRMIEEYNQTLQKKKQLLQSASSSNPLIINLNQTLEDLSVAILENVRSAKNGLRITQGNLQANANKYDAQIARVPAMERELLDISREQNTKEGLYLYLLQKREEEVLSLAAPVSSTRIISLPKANMRPVSPNKIALYLGGLLLGLFIPFATIFGKEVMNNKVSSLEELNQLTAAPILGEIANSTEKSPIVTTHQKRSPTAELFRLMRYNLEYLKKTDKNQTLLVTSTIKGEGKTFIAANLAASLASFGEKVALLSFDLRQPKLLQNLGLPDEPGITDFILEKDTSLNQIVTPHPSIKNLYLVGSGTTIPQVGNLMLSKRIADLMEVLKNNFDRIIIDTAPIGSVSDAFALNEYIDSTIYVVRQDMTKKEHLKTLRNIHQNGKLKNTMALFNDTSSGKAYGYSYDENNIDYASVRKEILKNSKKIIRDFSIMVKPFFDRLALSIKKRLGKSG
ncbi:GumC family protein [Pareuzebyella sediminis]|uniref:GumC family protein n=1 Tax=Pareuzebyella sediminis TaxID=2607998 RepID=UPI0011EF1A37|nr:tyrosine-protein kinase family protein [Pareuzebyella sediminis]